MKLFEGIKRQQQRRLKRKERNKVTHKEPEPKVDVTNEQTPISVEMPIHESDLETSESETDEEFYDR